MIKWFKVRYISDRPSLDFIKGGIYDAYIPLDMPNGKLLGLRDRNGEEYAYPTSHFERI